MTVTEDIRYIGVNDHDIDLFEAQYTVPEGMSYNSYVILDEKVAVLDTVDGRFGGEWLGNLEKELSGRTPDTVQSPAALRNRSPYTHTTLSGSALRSAPGSTRPASLYCSDMLLHSHTLMDASLVSFSS